VLELMEASVRMAEGLADRPFIALSMGSLGMVSRISGILTGSCLTFGTAGEASAPGQPDAKRLKAALGLLAGPAGEQD
jgi:3-dehydroquinate dehydratase-1